ncbi:MAG: PAS domain-containing protein [Campylobacteraceae bacterium]|nr:PAS domain-containing protein [Campylobacteraceae bacterium]
MSREIKLHKDTMIVSETNTKGIILYANADFCEIAGYTKDELIGSGHNMVRHNDMPKAAFKDLWSHMQDNKVWNGIVKNKCKNGDYYWVNATVYNVTKSDGEKRHVSVRVKPTELEVKNAITLYKTLN